MLYLAVALALCMAVQAQDFPPDLCCMPDDYEGFIGEAGCEGLVGSPPDMYNSAYSYAYSTTRNMIFWRFSYDPIRNRDEVLIDFNQGPPIQYVTYLNGTCQQEESNERMNRRCENDFDDRLFAYEKGFPPVQFDAFTTYTPDPNPDEYAVSFSWDGTCSLLFASVVYTGRQTAFGSYANSFMNTTNGIADPSVFDIPQNCAPPTGEIVQQNLPLNGQETMVPVKRALGITPM